MPPQEVRLDVRGLEPCEPMDRILQRIEELGAGERLRALISREPVPLYPLLEQRQFAWRVARLEPACCELLIWRAGDPIASAVDPAPDPR